MCANVILNYIIYAEWTQTAMQEHMGVVLEVAVWAASLLMEMIN